MSCLNFINLFSESAWLFVRRRKFNWPLKRDFFLRTKKSCAGFSLLEVMFVLAVLGTITLVGVSIYEQRVKIARVEKAAVQMQLLLQAGQAYYAENNAWPKTLKDLLPNYLNNNSNILISPFGSQYALSPNQEPQSQMFNIDLPINQSFYQDVGTLLANRLPNAVFQNNMVTASVNAVPFGNNGGVPEDTIIKKIVSFNHNQSKIIDKPQCPNNQYEPKLYVSLERIKPAYIGTNASLIKEIKVLKESINNNTQWRTEVLVNSQAGPGEGDVVAIAYCEKNDLLVAKSSSQRRF